MNGYKIVRIAAAILAAMMVSSIILLIFVQAKRDEQVVVSKIEKTTQVQMPELEMPAEIDSAMVDEAIEQWHRFCEVYCEEVPLTDDEQWDLFLACDEFNIDYFLMLGLINRETHFQNEVGDGGESFGYCQIQPKWWEKTMQEIGAGDLMVPKDNFRTACAIMQQMFERYGCGNLTDALTAYNTNHGGNSEYAKSVIAYQEEWASVILP